MTSTGTRAIAALAFAFMSAPALAVAANIIVVSNDGANEGYNDPTPATPVGGNPGTTVGAQRLFATQHAVQVWATRLASTVDITVRARFDPLPCNATSGSLGRAGALTAHQNFTNAPRPNTLYPAALANAIAGTDLNGATPEIQALFNINIDNNNACLNGVDYYYGIDGNSGNDVDLVTVVVHELTHGLGMFTTVDLTTGAKLMGLDDAYMVHLEDHSTGAAWPAMSNAQRLASARDTNDLHWTGANVVAGSTGLTSGRHPSGHVEMHAPTSIQTGSSVSHFATRLTPNELLEPVSTGNNSDPGLAVPLMQDLGWNLITVGVCGDGTVQSGEACDDGNNVNGDCCSSTCTFEPNGSACGSATSADCDMPDTCDGAGTCNTNRVAAGTTCRASVGLCDAAETCDGTSPSCPPDAPSPAGAVCRASTSTCDAVEQCDGVSTTCPPDAAANAGVVCRASAGPCDVAESCDGVSTACPADAGANAGTICRAANGVCDVAEACDGTSPACPADVGANAGTVCRPANGVCDVAEACDGTSPACPPDLGANAGTVCRPGAGVCDAPEVCDGMSPTCPADAAAPSGTVCRPARSECDQQEVCNGTSRTCPRDRTAPPGTVCRAANGACDAPELCNGVDGVCPDDELFGAGTVCRAAASACDFEERCDGRSAACPFDAVAPAGVPCRESRGQCDLGEVCDGVRGTCPADQKVARGTTCREAAGACDLREVCDGRTNDCPLDAFANGLVCREAADACDSAESCDGSSPACPADVLATDGTPCGGANACLEGRACQGGVCTMGAPIVCDDGDPCTADACVEGVCETEPIAACNPGEDPPPLALQTAEPVGCACSSTDTRPKRPVGHLLGVLGLCLAWCVRRRPSSCRSAPPAA